MRRSKILNPMSSLNIRINGFDNHCVLDDPCPSITLIKSAGTIADHCCVGISTVDGQACWTSGLIPFYPHVRYAGDLLQPKTTYTVTAVLYHSGEISAKSQASFETGFMGASWSAHWIEPQQESAVREQEIPFHELFGANPDFFGGQDRLRPCREVKKSFFLETAPVRARIYASAHGIYELFVNGVAAGRGLFSPETSAYQKLLYYQSFDVTTLLRSGENEIMLLLADGWWIGRIGISGDSCQYGDRLGCIVQADIVLSDGIEISIGSDTSFLGRRSRIDYADLFIGQRIDCTRADEPWSPCSVADFGKDNLSSQPTESVEVYAQYEPDWTVSAKGECIADFGRCLAGVTDITVDADGGQEVTLDFCEVLDKDGNFLRNILGRNKDQRDVFVCAEGENHFSPRFTYHGFRYARITGARRKQIKNMTASALGTRLRSRGRFSCSDDRLNRLQKNILQSTRSNMVSVPTDCPQREKAGWTGDILAFGPTGCFNFYLDGFLSAWLTNMRLEQFESGEIPVVIPNYPMQEKIQKGMGGSSSSAWSDACILVPWDIYQSYGDPRVLHDNEPMMERWLSFVERQCRQEPEDMHSRSQAELKWNDFLLNTGFHFGDWFIPSFMRRKDGVFAATAATKDVVGSCFHAIALDTYLQVLKVMAEQAGVRHDLEEKYAKIAKRLHGVRDAIRECYINDEGVVARGFAGTLCYDLAGRCC